MWKRQEKVGPLSSLVATYTAGKVKHSLTHCHFLQQEKSWVNQGSLSTEFCYLGSDAGKVNFFPFTLRSVSNFDFLLLLSQWCFVLLLDSLTPINGLSFTGDCVSQFSPEAPKQWLRVAGVSSKGIFRVHSQDQILYSYYLVHW